MQKKIIFTGKEDNVKEIRSILSNYFIKEIYSEKTTITNDSKQTTLEDHFMIIKADANYMININDEIVYEEKEEGNKFITVNWKQEKE